MLPFTKTLKRHTHYLLRHFLVIGNEIPDMIPTSHNPYSQDRKDHESFLRNIVTVLQT